ncbi:MAG: hypothetical protein AAGB02_05055 [Pseudomonadota bacterium]
MARPRKPSNLLELSGAFDKNPQRRRVDPAVEIGLGAPPDYFDDDARALWAEIDQYAPEGVLAKSDRFAVELLVPVMIAIRRGEPVKAGDRAFALSILTRMGCTPSDRSRLASPKADEPEQGELLLDLVAAFGEGAATH